MTIHTHVGAKRRKLSLPFSGRNTEITDHAQECASPLSGIELRRLVAAMVD